MDISPAALFMAFLTAALALTVQTLLKRNKKADDLGDAVTKLAAETRDLPQLRTDLQQLRDSVHSQTRQLLTQGLEIADAKRSVETVGSALHKIELTLERLNVNVEHLQVATHALDESVKGAGLGCARRDS